tara:strand:- start:643 stop:807 length:165 start_codon:yes stop_codon:yes gene_type:complete
MSNLYKSLKEIIKINKKNSSLLRKKEELYLSRSVDLIDLERRQKEIDSRFTRKL